MKITLVRHGEIDNAYLNCYNGHIDIGLSERGRKQAKALAEAFRGRTFDAVYCSDLRRAKQTLAPFALGRKPIYTQMLREKSWGRHEGMDFDAICEREGLEYENFGQWIDALDGEPLDAYIGRVRRFFCDELPQTGSRDLLVMTHAGVIRALYAIIMELPPEKAFAIAFPYGALVTLDTKKRQFGEIIACAA
jgi:alpha-ribazole phosphatase